MTKEKLRILALAAHADDLEILCAGTLARWTAAGHQVTMATMTWCQFGSYKLTLDECSRVRHAEAAAAASLIGATYKALMAPDNMVSPYDETQQRKVIELIRQTRPDIILTHAPNDYHTDHANLSELVRWTGPLLGMPQFETASPALDYTPALYWMDTLSGRGFEPTFYVDISETMDMKLMMLGCYASQIPFLLRYYGIDIVEQVRTIGRFRGLQAGVPFAEGFQRHMGAGWGNLTVHYLP